MSVWVDKVLCAITFPAVRVKLGLIAVKRQILKSTGMNSSGFASCREHLRKQAHQWIGPVLRRRVDTSDLVQETIVYTIGKYAQLLGKSKREIYRWMVSVMKYRLMHHVELMQKEYSETDGYETECDARGMLAIEQLMTAELRLLVEKEVASLAADQQMIYRLRYQDELKFSQIAHEMQRSEASIRSLHHRMLIELKPKIQKYFR